MSKYDFLDSGRSRKSKTHTFPCGKVCHFALFGGSGRPPTFQELEFSLGKQYFLRKSEIPGNRDRVVRVGAKIMILPPPPGGLAFLSDGGGPRANSLMSGYGGRGGYGSPSRFPPFLLLTLLHLSTLPSPPILYLIELILTVT